MTKEEKKQYDREYRKRPEVKAKRKQERSLPEYKKYHTEYLQCTKGCVL